MSNEDEAMRLKLCIESDRNSINIRLLNVAKDPTTTLHSQSIYGVTAGHADIAAIDAAIESLKSLRRTLLGCKSKTVRDCLAKLHDAVAGHFATANSWKENYPRVGDAMATAGYLLGQEQVR